MIQKTNPEGFIFTNTYDATGRNTSATDPAGKTKSVSYDSLMSATVTEKNETSWSRTFNPDLNVPLSTVDQLGSRP
jgi:YD repeat-containing protein